MADFSSVPVLSFDRVRLEPLTAAHEAGLLALIGPKRAPRLRAFLLAFAVIDEDTGKIVGSTSLYHIDPTIPRLYIGFTWYALSARRTRINTACKIMLLDYVFDTLNCRCACWQTDNLNTASQRAIERLGAHQDGILRCHKLRKDGSVRDTVEYSLLREEWPQARVKLLEKAAAYDAS